MRGPRPRQHASNSRRGWGMPTAILLLLGSVRLSHEQATSCTLKPDPRLAEHAYSKVCVKPIETDGRKKILPGGKFIPAVLTCPQVWTDFVVKISDGHELQAPTLTAEERDKACKVECYQLNVYYDTCFQSAAYPYPSSSLVAAMSNIRQSFSAAVQGGPLCLGVPLDEANATAFSTSECWGELFAKAGTKESSSYNLGSVAAFAIFFVMLGLLFVTCGVVYCVYRGKCCCKKCVKCQCCQRKTKTAVQEVGVPVPGEIFSNLDEVQVEVNQLGGTPTSRGRATSMGNTPTSRDRVGSSTALFVDQVSTGVGTPTSTRGRATSMGNTRGRSNSELSQFRKVPNYSPGHSPALRAAPTPDSTGMA